MRRSFSKSPQSGIAMVNILIIVAMISLMLASMIEHNHSNINLAMLVKDRSDAELSLQTVKSRVIYTLMTEPAEQLILNQLVTEDQAAIKEGDVKISSWNFFNLPFHFSGATVKIQDQSALLHAVYPDPDRLKSLLSDQLSVVDSARAYGAIIDWQDADNNVSNNGAERFAYPDLPDGPRNGGIPHVDDLRHVANISPQILQTLKQNMSLYRGSLFNPMLAPKSLIAGLYGIERANVIEDLRLKGALTPELFASNTGFEESMISTLTNSRTIKLSLITRVNEAYAYESAVISFNPNSLSDENYVINHLTMK